MSTSSSLGGCCHEAVNGWPSGNGFTCGGNINCEQSILGTRCHVCVCGGYMKMVLTCVEASLCVSIYCGSDSLKQRMVPSLSMRVLVACRYAARVRTMSS